MDTKLKSNRKLRRNLGILGILAVTIITMCFFPFIHEKGQENLAVWLEDVEVEEEINSDLLKEIYEGCYVLYLEAANRQEEVSAFDLYMEASYVGTDEEKAAYLRSLKENAESYWNAYANSFEIYRSEIDYCMDLAAEGSVTNTNQPLEQLLSRRISSTTETSLQGYYNAYFIIDFDENGNFSVKPLHGSEGSTDAIVKIFGRLSRETSVWKGLAEEYETYGIDCSVKPIKDFRVLFAIPKTSSYQLMQSDYESGYDYWAQMNAYRDAGADLLYVGALAVLVLLAFVMTSSRLWGDEISMNRPGKCYLMETAWIAAICVVALVNSFVRMIWSYDEVIHYATLPQRIMSGEAGAAVVDLLGMGISIFCIYACWYLAVLFIRPMFALGFKEYVRQYSFFYQMFPWVKGQWEKLKKEAEHVDFSEDSVKTIIKLVVVNFVIVAICSLMWVAGILFLVMYSVILFFVIDHYYNRMEENYNALRRGVRRIAEGDLETEITDDLGVFEPIKEELGKVRTGFKKAVDEEVKSQRMKTELITNVSHDLKTPLTAITTYVELLKKEDITEEERRSYIDTLDRKSLRLKVLIEDLFEVSKASSNSITLNLMDVDVVKLLKQVSVEHKDKYEQMGLDLRWNVPTEKVILQLDNQKTYRIFENLFVNIQKYAMPNSRVYIDVKMHRTDIQAKTDNKEDSVHPKINHPEKGFVEITIKNISAEELNISSDELTERFVRGDASRNTEGSGLGLAIARSFTEAQGGHFHVEVDGDLFKAVISWKQ